VAIPKATGGLLVATPSGLMTFDSDTKRVSPLCHPESERTANRYNDGKCDRMGRLWIGTLDMGTAANRGSLFRVDADGSWKKLDTGFTVANGLGWSPDNKLMYLTDSSRRIIYAYAAADTDARPSANQLLFRRPESRYPLRDQRIGSLERGCNQRSATFRLALRDPRSRGQRPSGDDVLGLITLLCGYLTRPWPSLPRTVLGPLALKRDQGVAVAVGLGQGDALQEQRQHFGLAGEVELGVDVAAMDLYRAFGDAQTLTDQAA
jgi:hypothetical protein